MIVFLTLQALSGSNPCHNLSVRLYIKRNSFVIMLLVSAQGFEPRTHGLEGRCSIQLSYAPTLERMMGIEPTLSAWKPRLNMSGFKL